MIDNETNQFHAEVRARFGVLPNFFCTAVSAPGLIEELWGFAKSAYLDSPLPSLFKERLFVHLSRFCEVRYCIVRHVGFLVGEGRPAGDATVRPQSIEEAIALLRKPVPQAQQLNRSLRVLEESAPQTALPEADSEREGELFDALAILFIHPRGNDRARAAITRVFGESTFELLIAFLAFVRTAHYWTENHPALEYEQDVVGLMTAHPTLASLMLDTADADWARSTAELKQALTELRQTSGALRSTEERFRALATATSDMLFRMSPDWLEMWSLDGRGFLANTSNPDSNWRTRYIPDDERSRVKAAIAQAVATKSMFELEHRVLRPNGAVGWVLSRAVPILDINGEVTEWFGAAIDLTARKEAEDALRKADRRKDEFLATLAHELRNPLAPLRNGLEIARRQTPSSETLSPTIEMMDRQVSLLVHLVDDLLDVSRITSGKIELRRAQVSVQKVISASVDASRAVIDARGHRFVLHPCAEELLIDGDFDRLTQVFSNLLSNAAKYTEDAGTIEIRVAREKHDVVVSVVDTGIGIPSEHLADIFDIFAQVRSHQGRADGGLGIGLSLVNQLVKMHDGTVRATSAGVNQGSTFTVRLPLAVGDAVMPSPRGTTPSKTSIPRQRILVVDDNHDAASSLATLLTDMGHEVMTARDGLDGLEKAAVFLPQAVFLDLGMPRMDGIEAAKRLRTQPEGRHATLVALTGWGQEQDFQRTRAAGFDHHLLKPIDVTMIDLVLQGNAAVSSR